MKDVTERDIFTKIVNHPDKNDRIAWLRKHKKLKTMIEETITPLETQILELTMTKMAFMDDIMELRDSLVAECIHPREFLLTKEDHILCKFCDSKLKVNVQPQD